ncbi:MAG: GTPase [Lachnospiraceae bacterium]|nr:GTPase [Lachnospiraceae bacterium]MDY5869394.1 GTP-binding protein [Lachnospiraceae bacterium]
MKPVYIINGFLESGKTEFICYTLDQPYFQIKGRTLLLVCEEGENEYEEKLLKKSRTDIEYIEEEEDFNPPHLIELEKKYKPERIIIEYNGMWNFKNIKLPFHWTVEQQITTIDASTFPMYYTNMKSLLAEMLRKSEMIIFNRCDDVVEELSNYKRNVKAINQKADIIFEDAQGEINQIFEDDLPYSLDAPIIELDNEGYGIWYLDSLDNLDRYIGKTIQFVAMVLKPEEFPKNYFVPGRMAMTCCAEDMAFLGFACEYDKADKLRDKQWVKVTAKVAKEYFADYGGEGPVLKAVSVEQTKEPKERIISFT